MCKLILKLYRSYTENLTLLDWYSKYFFIFETLKIFIFTYVISYFAQTIIILSEVILCTNIFMQMIHGGRKQNKISNKTILFSTIIINGICPRTVILLCVCIIYISYLRDTFPTKLQKIKVSHL